VNVLVGAALAVGLLVVLPLVAHFLRRGRAAELPFPPAALVKATQTASRRERKLEDRALFATRALAVIALALLGATPLVRCERLSLARGGAGALAVAIVLDDSLSMRAKPSGEASRWERGRDAASRLLDSMREGDSVAFVLAGKPARVALARTTDLTLARRTLKELTPSDRSTDLASAYALARSSFGGSTRATQRLVVLSDFAAPAPAAGEPMPWAPLPELTRPLPDCGIASAERRESRVTATLACTGPDAARGRRVSLKAGATSLGEVALEPRAGVQTVTLTAPPASEKAALTLELDGEDAIKQDDLAAVAPDAQGLRVSVLADDAEGGAATGGPPLIEQVLAALERELSLRPLTVVPDQAADLERDALVILDDPSGFGPEARAALTSFVERGGMAVALLGPRAEAGRLGATLEPFVIGPVRWERKPSAAGADPASLGWLGAEAKSLTSIKPSGRAVVDVGRRPGFRVTGSWSDGVPLVIERELGRGLLTTVTLPSSITTSDFALRPGFVALLDHWLEAAHERRGLAQVVAGTTWSFGAQRASIVGPDGPLRLVESPDRGRTATPAVRGAYRVTTERGEEQRTVTVDPLEITAEPAAPPPENRAAIEASAAELSDASPEVAIFLLCLLGLELFFRARRVDARARFR
jgi:hypothetical protein